MNIIGWTYIVFKRHVSPVLKEKRAAVGQTGSSCDMEGRVAIVVLCACVRSQLQ